MRRLALLPLSLLFLTACQGSVSPKSEEQSSSSVPSAAGTVEASSFTRISAEIDEAASTLTFTGKSNIVNHEGHFGSFSAALALDSAEPQNLAKAKLTLSIDMASVASDNERLTAHLQKEDFFAVEEHPQATFASSSIEHAGGDAFVITGDLTIKGRTKTATINATITDEAIIANYDLPRRDFAVGNDSYGDKLLDPLVPVEAKLVFSN